VNEYPDHEALLRYLDATANDPHTYPHYAAILSVAKDTGHISNWFWNDTYSPGSVRGPFPEDAKFLILLPDVQRAIVEAGAIGAFLIALTPESHDHTNQGDTHG